MNTNEFVWWGTKVPATPHSPKLVGEGPQPPANWGNVARFPPRDAPKVPYQTKDLTAGGALEMERKFHFG